VVVKDIEAFATYMNDQDHLDLAARGSGRLLVQVMGCDFSDDFDPGLKDQIMKVIEESDIDPAIRERAMGISV